MGTMWARNLAQNLLLQALNGSAFTTDPTLKATQVSGDVTWFYQMTQAVKRKVETRMTEFYAVSTEIFPEATCRSAADVEQMLYSEFDQAPDRKTMKAMGLYVKCMIEAGAGAPPPPPLFG